MRSSTFPVLAALLSLVSQNATPCLALEESTNIPPRPQYYFPRYIKRAVGGSEPQKREPDGRGTTVVVVPVTVYVGPDGKPITLGGQTFTQTNKDDPNAPPTTTTSPAQPTDPTHNNGNGTPSSVGQESSSQVKQPSEGNDPLLGITVGLSGTVPPILQPSKSSSPKVSPDPSQHPGPSQGLSGPGTGVDAPTSSSPSSTYQAPTSSSFSTDDGFDLTDLIPGNPSQTPNPSQSPHPSQSPGPSHDPPLGVSGPGTGVDAPTSSSPSSTYQAPTSSSSSTDDGLGLTDLIPSLSLPTISLPVGNPSDSSTGPSGTPIQNSPSDSDFTPPSVVTPSSEASSASSDPPPLISIPPLFPDPESSSSVTPGVPSSSDTPPLISLPPLLPDPDSSSSSPSVTPGVSSSSSDTPPLISIPPLFPDPESSSSVTPGVPSSSDTPLISIPPLFPDPDSSSSSSVTPGPSSSSSDTPPLISLPPLFPDPDSSSSSSYVTPGVSSSSDTPPLISLPPLFPDPDSSSSVTPGPSSPSPSLSSDDNGGILPSISVGLSIPPLITPTDSSTVPSGSTSPSASESSSDGGIDISLPPILPTPSLNGTGILPTPGSSTPTATSDFTTPSGVFPPTGAVPTGDVPGSSESPSESPSSYETPSSSPSPSSSESESESAVTPTVPVSTSHYESPTSEPTQQTTPEPSSESLPPISTDSATELSVNPTIIVQPSVPPRPSSTNGATPKPSDNSVPGIITPAGGVPDQPDDTTLVQIGFNGSLSYEWVVSSPILYNQIFTFVPKGLSFGLALPLDNVVVKSIEPYHTEGTLGYVTTLAKQYIPSNMVPELDTIIHAPNSLLYQNPDHPVSYMMSMINPTIPLIPGGGDSSTIGGGNGGDDSDNGTNSAGKGPGGSGNTSGVNPTSVGIGLGVVGGAAVYGAAMFFVARRYRKKRSLHRRSDSLTSGMGEANVASGGVGDALMSGGRGEGARSTTPYGAVAARNSHGSGGSNRTQMISAPVMAENSLGWN